MGALSLMLNIEPKIRHLVLTCNRLEKLTTTSADDPKVKAITLDEPTNDKSLVMTSSFTNRVPGARFPGLVGHPEHYPEICDQPGGSDLRSVLS